MGNWALLMVRAAHVLQLATSEQDWQSFVVATTALIARAALEGIPIMRHILDTSVAAWQEEEPDLDGSASAENGRLPHA